MGQKQSQPTQPTTTQQPQGTGPLLLQSNTANQIINKQNTLISELNNILFNLKTSLKIPINSTTMESFTTNNTEPFINMSSVKLNPNKDTEIYNYANIYNQNIALLDDPNKMNQQSFATYIHIQDKKINNLKKELKQLEEHIQNNKTNKNNIKSFKSMSNSKIINVELYNDENKNNAVKYPNYLIYGNNGCLEYDNKKEY